MKAFFRNGAIFRNRPYNYQNSAIWPFVESRIVQAFSKLDLSDRAASTFETMATRTGCNEWYSPQTGKPKGSREQLLSAASLLDARNVLS